MKKQVRSGQLTGSYKEKVPIARHYRLIGIICTLLLLAIIAGGLWITPLIFQPQAEAAARGPYNPVARGPYRVQGNTIRDRDGHQYLFYGVSRDGLEYSCTGDGPLDRQHLAYMGSGVNSATETYWGSNTVRLPLSQGFWFNGSEKTSCTSYQYQALIKKTVQTLTDLQLNVILDLHWTTADGQVDEGGGAWAMPDDESVDFWQEIAEIYKNAPNVLFELYNEPHPHSWECWIGPCTMGNDKAFSNDCACTKMLTYDSPGMQALVDTIRETGARNLIIVGGMNWGYDLSKLENHPIRGNNLIYSTHPYPYEEKMPPAWDNAFGRISKKYPVISTESGQYDCGSDYMKKLINYFDAHKISWIAWAWTVNKNICHHPLLVQDFRGTPTKGMGEFLYRHLRSYAAGPGPAAKAWYFAEGHVGGSMAGSFEEHLLLANPDLSADCLVKIHYILDSGQSAEHSVTVPRGSRLDVSVNDHLEMPPDLAAGSGVSTMVTVDPATTCPGIVAERSLNFTWQGLRSGTVTMGQVKPEQTFYFVDVITDAHTSTLFTVFNPPANKEAALTISYVADGNVLHTETLDTIPSGQRLAFRSPPTLPTHTAAVLTASQPVVAEQTRYFFSATAEPLGEVSGVTTVPGIPASSDYWLFPEGSTGYNFQEYISLANLESSDTTAQVTIGVSSNDGNRREYLISVPPRQVIIWHANEHIDAGAHTIEVRAQGAPVVAERLRYFKYHGDVGSNSTRFEAIGVSASVGISKSSCSTAHTFIGHTGENYREMLVIQNPWGYDATVVLGLVGPSGRNAVQHIKLLGHERREVNLTALVQQNFRASTPGAVSETVIFTMQTLEPKTCLVGELLMYWNTSHSTGPDNEQFESVIQGHQGGVALAGYSAGHP